MSKNGLTSAQILFDQWPDTFDQWPDTVLCTCGTRSVKDEQIGSGHISDGPISDDISSDNHNHISDDHISDDNIGDKPISVDHIGDDHISDDHVHGAVGYLASRARAVFVASTTTATATTAKSCRVAIDDAMSHFSH